MLEITTRRCNLSTKRLKNVRKNIRKDIELLVNCLALSYTSGVYRSDRSDSVVDILINVIHLSFVDLAEICLQTLPCTMGANKFR